jgi:Leucine-rich repeat (LRR) protein
MKFFLLLSIILVAKEAVADIELKCIFHFGTAREWIGFGSELFGATNFPEFDKHQYTCLQLSTGVTYNNESVTNMIGQHRWNKTNDDVQWLIFKISKLYFLPKRIDKFLPNLEYLLVNSMFLTALTAEDLKQFPKLRYLWAANNKIKAISHDIFDNNPDLQAFDFENNLIEEIDFRIVNRLNGTKVKGSFINNTCINMDSLKSEKGFQPMDFFYCRLPNHIFCAYGDNLITNFTSCVLLDEYKRVEIDDIGGNFDSPGNIRAVILKLFKFTYIPRIIGEKFENLEVLVAEGLRISKLSYDDMQFYPHLSSTKPLGTMGTIFEF